MNWFNGSIPEAITLAKTANAVFVVYVHDTSEASTSTDEALVDEELSSILNSKKFVAIKLEHGTEGATQFSQIYPVIVLPSLYFISGSTGMPLEILGGAVNKEKLKEKLDQFTKGAESVPAKPQEEKPKAEDMQVDEPSVSSLPESAAAAETVNTETSEVSQSSTTPDPPTSSSSVSEAPENATSNAEDVAMEVSENDVDEEGSEQPLDEKVERAKQLLAEKQTKKDEEKAEENKKKEVDRRKTGQEIAKRKRQMYEEDVQNAARERKKEKDEDRAARERVKAQIAADRREREARAALLQGEAPPQEPAASVPPPNAPASNSGATSVRIKFRFPDGTSNIAQFPTTATLAEVRQHVQEQLLSSSNFMLTSTVHHRPFNAEDDAKSLMDLGLAPSAIIIILMNSHKSASGSVVPSNGGIMEFFWLLLSPFTFLLGFIRQLFSGGSGASSRADSTQAGSSQGQSTTQQRPSTSYGRYRGSQNREGNIHRLRNSNDDDENNTWNGNSTQQM